MAMAMEMETRAATMAMAMEMETRAATTAMAMVGPSALALVKELARDFDQSACRKLLWIAL